tara:strand:+ start:4638 stop:5753 length:1116 start_codon:yes stop_codon:yes gene_type:complete
MKNQGLEQKCFTVNKMFAGIKTKIFKNTFDNFIFSKKQYLKILTHKYTFFDNSGSEILAKLISTLNIENDKNLNVYLPGYFCGQSLKYLRSLNVNIFFYKLSEKLLPDYQYLKELDLKNKIDVLILVHYFGRIRGQADAAKFAKNNKIILIEDCAHIDNPLRHDLWVGDYLIFSPHKHFSIPFVGILFSKKNMNLLNMRYSNKFFWFLKSFLKKFIKYDRKTKWGKIFNKNTSDFEKYSPSIFIQNLAINCIKKQNREKKSFLNNIDLLNKKLSNISGWKPLISFYKKEIPYILPMVCDSKEIAKRRFYLLNKKYKIAMQWPDLPEEIKYENIIFKKEIFDMVDKIIFLKITNNFSNIFESLNLIYLNVEF